MTASAAPPNNARSNHIWQSAYLDQQNELVTDRWPYPFIQMNPQDMAELNLKAGDLVEIYNDNGSTQAMVYPTPTAKRKQTFMMPSPWAESSLTKSLNLAQRPARSASRR